MSNLTTKFTGNGYTLRLEFTTFAYFYADLRRTDIKIQINGQNHRHPDDDEVYLVHVIASPSGKHTVDQYDRQWSQTILQRYDHTSFRSSGASDIFGTPFAIFIIEDKGNTLVLYFLRFKGLPDQKISKM